MNRKHVAAASAVAALFAASAFAGADLVAYPKEKGLLYGTVDRADNKQVRELYAPKAAIDAAKAGKPLPDGTALTMLVFKAKVDAKGEPVKDAKGRFEKADPVAHMVMQKNKGWGKDYGPDMRNGEWEYRAFAPDGKANEKADLKPCFTCHLPKAKDEFTFSIDKMKTVAAK